MEQPEQLIEAIEEMKISLNQKDGANFPQFWAARERCFACFKEKLSPPVRKKYWELVQELTQQAKSLSEIANKDVEFAIEQIAKSLEMIQEQAAEYVKYASVSELPKISDDCRTFQKIGRELAEKSQQIAFLNALGEKIERLRAEVSELNCKYLRKKEMFDLLSHQGDFVFPIKKQLIEELSSSVLEPVLRFLEQQKKSPPRVPFGLKKEIMAIQATIKQIPLTMKVRKKLRGELKEAWTQMSEIEKKFNVEKAEQTEKLKEELNKANMRIAQLQKTVENSQMNLEQIEKACADLGKQFKGLKLPEKELGALHAGIEQLLEPHYKKRAIIEEQRDEQEKRIKEKKNSSLKVLLEKIEQAKKSGLDALYTLQSEVQALACKSLEEEEVELQYYLAEQELLYKHLLDLIEKDLKEESEHAAQNLSKMVKERIDSLKKTASRSGLAFEQSLKLSEQIEQEKQRLSLIRKCL